MKLSSYQKLKKRNQELINDIIILVGDPKSVNEEMTKVATELRWRLKFDIEKLIMFGNSTPKV